MRYYSHSPFLSLFPPLRLRADLSMVLTQKDYEEPLPYCEPKTLPLCLCPRLSFSRSAAADRLTSSFPEVIISQHARLCSAHSETVQGSSPLRPDCSHYLSSSTDRKTIDECTLNLIPVPPGSKGTLELLEHTSLRNTDLCFLGQIIIHPGFPDKGNLL